ncbi:MAG TPA: CoA transferase [Caldimonas sp.]|jgi:crotonobetainyl-CoA:carnitine CoA-transferase CaiB-like acyl-CoA transferase|nr:CoA transferase [Caldimonas sp.]
MPTPPAPDALAGLKVLDFSIMMAGPYCARLLADVGADVVKVEPPEGDDMRLRAPLRDGESAYFGQLNAGKRSLAVDLKDPACLALVKSLAAVADVVIENFRPGVMERLGLGSAALRAANPRLVYCSISGYGQEGPAAGKAAYAMIVQAESGFEKTLARYAGVDRPAPTATFAADVLGAIFAYGAIQTALVQRGRTGVGQAIDVSLMDAMLNLLVYELQEAQFPVTTARPTYGPVRANDGDVLVVPITARNFEALCAVTGSAALRTDARFASLPARNSNWHAMMALIEGWTRERSVAECVAAFTAAGVPASAYGEPGDSLADPHLRARGVFARVADAAGTFTGINPPYRMSGSRAELRGVVPALGADREPILREWLDVPK